MSGSSWVSSGGVVMVLLWEVAVGHAWVTQGLCRLTICPSQGACQLDAKTGGDRRSWGICVLPFWGPPEMQPPSGSGPSFTLCVFQGGVEGVEMRASLALCGMVVRVIALVSYPRCYECPPWTDPLSVSSGHLGQACCR